MTPRSLLLLGATGTIGRAVAQAARARGHAVVALVRPGAAPPDGVQALPCDLGDAQAVAAAVAQAGAEAGVAAVVSCLASRSGTPADAWAVDHAAHSCVLHAAVAAGVPQWVQVSAICLQKPRLPFQHAKLAFEAELRASPLAWTILRPTAFFKSLSGQVARVAAGKPFLLFGDGRQTACKPISDHDLAKVVIDALDDPTTQGRVLPLGGPGPALTPLDQAAILARLLGRPVPLRRVPLALMGAIAGGLGLAGRVVPRLADKAALARIGQYYATESMLVWDAAQGRYDADATPEYGTDRLADHYARLLAGTETDQRGAHAVF